MKTYEVRAHWDADAGVWWAESDDVPGLVAEAETLDQLQHDLRELVPELMRLNKGWAEGSMSLKVLADRTEVLRPA